MYNPIELACQHYLTEKFITDKPKIKELFICAQTGLTNLIETYKNCSVMRICLNYYLSLISNYLEDKKNDKLFRKDNVTAFYTLDILNKLHKIWTSDKIKIVLNITTYLLTNEHANTDVNSLETIINGIDKLVQSEMS